MSELVEFQPQPVCRKRKQKEDEEISDDNDFGSVVESETDGNSYPCTRKNAGYTSVMLYQESKGFPATGQEMLDRQISDQSESQNPERSNKQLNAELSSFVQKKSFAQNMMDIALLSANTNQLRYVIDLGDRHPYYMTSLALIILSLLMQIVVGLAMLGLNRYNMKDRTEIKAASHMNNLSLVGVFLVTLLNVFISTFNGTGAPSVVTTPGTNGTNGTTNALLNFSMP
uniref:Ninjurin a n=1 Tax=Anopheles farauti TaxID=69004 RepID=A0A182QYF6_9DIPT